MQNETKNDISRFIHCMFCMQWMYNLFKKIVTTCSFLYIHLTYRNLRLQSNLINPLLK